MGIKITKRIDATGFASGKRYAVRRASDTPSASEYGVWGLCCYRYSGAPNPQSQWFYFNYRNSFSARPSSITMTVDYNQDTRYLGVDYISDMNKDGFEVHAYLNSIFCPVGILNAWGHYNATI